MNFQCPPTPNCVSSDACSAHQKIAPFPLQRQNADDCWQALTTLLTEMPHLKIEQQDDTRIHAIAKTRLLRFKDDLYFERRPDQIAVKSSSRVGYSDLGTNRRRLESLRNQYLLAIEAFR